MKRKTWAMLLAVGALIASVAITDSVLTGAITGGVVYMFANGGKN